MQVEVRNKLIITDYPSEVMDWCKKNLVLDNPEYHKKERMGLWLGKTPREIWLFERIGNSLHVPFGCVKDMHNLFGNAIKYDYQIRQIRAVNYSSNINLYSYQENAVKAVLERRNGILVAPCGSGKTNMGMEIIARIGGRALWLTHTQDLLNQSMNRAKAVLNTSASYGKITAGKVDIGTGITFATVQTMSKLDLTQYQDTWDVIIVDECQHCAGSPTRVTQFYKVISQLSARYKIGLTATPKRADGLEKSMFALLGGIIYEVTKEDVKHTTCPIKVQFINTDFQPNYDIVLMGDGTINYAKLIDNMIQDERRLNVIWSAIAGLNKSGAMIVLANRVEYLKRLCDMYKKAGGNAICLSGMSQSKKAKEERKRALNALNRGELDCVFATYQLAKEGLDCPHLRYIIFATPEKDETTVTQSVGRVARKADGKEYGTVIDFIDDFGMFRGWQKKRMKIYKKLDADVVDNV